jgi:putative colanic acid biosynthesis acetyltransferase WcaB
MSWAGRVHPLKALKSDRAANSRDPKAILVMTSFRITQWAMGPTDRPRMISWPLIALYRLLTEFILGLELRPKTQVGPGLSIHHGFGLVVNDHAVIGSDVKLRNGVTIGHKKPGDGAPVLEDRVEVGAGALIIGNITIGHDAVIGAGSVVTKPVPAHGVVVGNPARLISTPAAHIDESWQTAQPDAT